MLRVARSIIVSTMGALYPMQKYIWMKATPCELVIWRNLFIVNQSDTIRSNAVGKHVILETKLRALCGRVYTLIRALIVTFKSTKSVSKLILE